jgi:exportin-2 (importin alpha re-exporter)
MFKNYVKRNWRVIEEAGNRIHESDRTNVKQTIVDLMLKSPEQIQRQLSDAISIIGREDFPAKWPDLLNEMVAKFQIGDFHVINGVLRTAHSLFKRYRHEFKSNELWTEIKFVLENFAKPLTELFNSTMELAKTHANNPDALKVIFSSLVLICKIFYSLNFQDLPEFFEDNMGTWMNHFHTLLTVDNKLLQTHDGDEAGLLEQVKSQVCDNIAMYAQKYDEEFSPHLPTFVTAVWHLLINTGSEVKYDLLVSNAIQFLASVAERPGYKHLFENHDTLKSICEKVIVPNMEFRDADEEAFEDNPEEYIRRDIEGSDIDTRRRAACDLVRALSKHFEDLVISTFSMYVQFMLQEYAKNPSQNWKSKDAAVFLVTSLAAKAQTQKHGITQTSSLVDVTDFFRGNIAPDLQSSETDENPVLKADAIKYVLVFRQQLPRDVLLASLPLIINHLKASSPVVHSYAACALEKLFLVRGPNGGPLITKTDMDPHCNNLLQGLLHAMTLPGSLENEYLMKALMRSLSLLQETALPLLEVVLVRLTEKLMLVSKNPSKPHFNHYLFEAICICIRNACKVNIGAVVMFEEKLFGPFQEILQHDVQEFIPYILQILSLLLEVHTDSVPEPYMALFPHLLLPVLWERPGNIPPLVRLLQAYIEKGAQRIEADKVPGLLGIFQKLLASKSNDHQGFYLLNTMIEHMPPALFQQYLKQIFVLTFQRLTNSKTTKYVRSLLVFFALFAYKYSPSQLIQIVDGIQNKMFGMVLEKLFLPDLQKVSGNMERKICAVGLVRLLTEAPEMLQPPYDKCWAPLLQSLIGLFELPEDDSVPEEEHFVEIEDTAGYQTAYSQLMFAGKHEHDPVKGVDNPKLHLAQALHRLSQAHPGKLTPMVGGIEPQARTFLQGYLSQAGISLQ